MKKTIIALLPAIIAHLGAFVISKTNADQPFWIWILAALILAGAGISANYITKYLKEKKPDKGPLFRAFIGFLVFVGYVVTFVFTGCLVALTGLNL